MDTPVAREVRFVNDETLEPAHECGMAEFVQCRRRQEGTVGGTVEISPVFRVVEEEGGLPDSPLSRKEESARQFPAFGGEDPQSGGQSLYPPQHGCFQTFDQ